MPRYARTPCLDKDCVEYATKRGRCDEHQPKPWKGSNTAGLRTAEYKRVRTRVLARDSHLCVSCGAKATCVDHIKPRAKGGTDAPDNLRSLCEDCHQIKTISDRRVR